MIGAIIDHWWILAALLGGAALFIPGALAFVLLNWKWVVPSALAGFLFVMLGLSKHETSVAQADAANVRAALGSAVTANKAANDALAAAQDSAAAAARAVADLHQLERATDATTATVIEEVAHAPAVPPSCPAVSPRLRAAFDVLRRADASGGGAEADPRGRAVGNASVPRKSGRADGRSAARP